MINYKEVLHLLGWCRDHSGSVASYPVEAWGLPHRTDGRPEGFPPWRRPLCSLPGWPRRYFPCAYLNPPPLHGRHHVVPCPRTRSRPTPHLQTKHEGTYQISLLESIKGRTSLWLISLDLVELYAKDMPPRYERRDDDFKKPLSVLKRFERRSPPGYVQLQIRIFDGKINSPYFNGVRAPRDDSSFVTTRRSSAS